MTTASTFLTFVQDEAELLPEQQLQRVIPNYHWLTVKQKEYIHALEQDKPGIMNLLRYNQADPPAVLRPIPTHVALVQIPTDTSQEFFDSEDVRGWEYYYGVPKHTRQENGEVVTKRESTLRMGNELPPWTRELLWYSSRHTLFPIQQQWKEQFKAQLREQLKLDSLAHWTPIQQERFLYDFPFFRSEEQWQRVNFTPLPGQDRVYTTAVKRYGTIFTGNRERFTRALPLDEVLETSVLDDSPSYRYSSGPMHVSQRRRLALQVAAAHVRQSHKIDASQYELHK